MEIWLILLTFFSLYFVRKNTIELKTTKNPIMIFDRKGHQTYQKTDLLNLFLIKKEDCLLSNVDPQLITSF